MTSTNHELHFCSSIAIVEQYLDFFERHQHVKLSGGPLAVAGNSTSFIIAGMQPLLPYLRGEQLPPALRLTALQRCLRSDDTDAVGINGRKNSFFHMLGNWSLGDYDKRSAIEMALDLLLNVFQLARAQLWVTVFAGDSTLGIPLDEIAIAQWERLGIPRERIVPLGIDDNLWTMGDSGPCGPCSEIFVDRGPAYGCGSSTCRPGCACDRFLEVWNLVFMEYELFADGHIAPLPQRNIDTGMGLERMAAALQDAESVFSIDLFLPAVERLQTLAPTGSTQDSMLERRARRMIVDHTRAAMFAILEGVRPERDGRGFVVRRLIRRAARQGRLLGLDQPFLYTLVQPLEQAHGLLITLEERQRIPLVVQMIQDEERRFERVLTIGLKYLARLEPDQSGRISGQSIFDLHAEKGFPADLATEILAERGLRVDWDSYETAQEEHRRVSRLSAERHFGEH